MAWLVSFPLVSRARANAAWDNSIRAARPQIRYRVYALIASAILFGLSLACLLVLSLAHDPFLNALNIPESSHMLGLPGAIGFCLLTGVALSALAVSIIAPVVTLAQRATEIAAGNLDHYRALERGDELGDLAAALDQMRRQLQSARGEKERHQRELEMVNEIALTASQLLDPQRILDLTIQLAVENLGVQAGAIYLLNRDSGRLQLHACQGMPECRAMACQLLRLNHVLAGLMQPDSRVVSVPIGADSCYGMWQDAEGRAFVGVPLRAHGVVTGAMTLVTHPQQRLTDEGARMLKTMGEAIGLALENAMDYENARNRATVAERERLARELHDSLAQALAYLKLKASVTHDLLASGQIAQAQDNLRQVKEIAKETYLDVREQIFGLRQQSSAGSAFLPGLAKYLADYSTAYKIDVQLELKNERTPEWPEDICIQLTRIIQEALTNVRKHAQAQQARVCFEQVDHHWRVTVEDDGKGFDPRGIQSSGGQFLGLHIMRERADAVGATLELDSRPGGGTRVTVRVPLAR